MNSSFYIITYSATLKKRRKRLFLLNVVLIFLLSSQSFLVSGKQPDPNAPVLQNEHIHHHPITTSSPLAQRYFDQGLILYYAFNHEEAIRSFRKTIKQDPDCAMAYWGIALAYGPNINRPMPAEAWPKAYAALLKARELAAEASPKEQAYIEALSTRYEKEAIEDRMPLDVAYSKAMGRVMNRFPDDLDVATLFAESLMTTMPWDYWTTDLKPKDTTSKTITTLEAVLDRNPAHIGANHLYIHIVEAGPHPEQGLPSADRLRDIADTLPKLVSGTGHLVHMPGHIYLRVGLYNSASRANIRAIKADEAYLKDNNDSTYYDRLYYPHKYNYLSYTTMMEGHSKKSLIVTKHVAAQVEGNFPAAERLRVLPLFMLARFSQWDKILAAPAPQDDHLFHTAMWHYVRGLAYAANDQIREARTEAQRLASIENSPEASAFEVPFFYGLSQIHIAQEILAAEIAGLQGRDEAMIRHLEEAVALQDALPYMEPPYWYYPVRETLGATLLKRGQTTKAEAVYREDLQKNPWNGRSLNGLIHSLRAQGEEAEAHEIEKQLERAWQRSDVALKNPIMSAD